MHQISEPVYWASSACRILIQYNSDLEVERSIPSPLWTSLYFTLFLTPIVQSNFLWVEAISSGPQQIRLHGIRVDCYVLILYVWDLGTGNMKAESIMYYIMHGGNSHRQRNYGEISYTVRTSPKSRPSLDLPHV